MEEGGDCEILAKISPCLFLFSLHMMTEPAKNLTCLRHGDALSRFTLSGTVATSHMRLFEMSAPN